MCFRGSFGGQKLLLKFLAGQVEPVEEYTRFEFVIHYDHPLGHLKKGFACWKETAASSAGN